MNEKYCTCRLDKQACLFILCIFFNHDFKSPVTQLDRLASSIATQLVKEIVPYIFYWMVAKLQQNVLDPSSWSRILHNSQLVDDESGVKTDFEKGVDALIRRRLPANSCALIKDFFAASRRSVTRGLIQTAASILLWSHVERSTGCGIWEG